MVHTFTVLMREWNGFVSAFRVERLIPSMQLHRPLHHTMISVASLLESTRGRTSKTSA